jgi:hypothetical protein
VVLLTGPSGSGKTSLTQRLGLPVVQLDDFYLDIDHPGLPQRYGSVDWDSPETWDGKGALAALHELVTEGRADVPVYDIPTSRRRASAGSTSVTRRSSSRRASSRRTWSTSAAPRACSRTRSACPGRGWSRSGSGSSGTSPRPASRWARCCAAERRCCARSLR